MPYTLNEWNNNFVGVANFDRSQFILVGGTPTAASSIALDPHRWSKSDIINLQNLIKSITPGNFTAIPDYWSLQKYEELANRLALIFPIIDELGSTFTSSSTAYSKYTFPNYDDYSDNINEPLNGNSEGQAAASTAYDEWQILNNLLITQASQSEVNTQIDVLNSAATTAWSLANAANTLRITYNKITSLFNVSRIETKDPILWRSFFTYVREGWAWHRTGIDMLIDEEDYSRIFPSAPNGLPILKNLGSLNTTQSMFYRNNVYPCYSQGTCAAVDVFIQDKFRDIDTEYETTLSMYPTYPV